MSHSQYNVEDRSRQVALIVLEKNDCKWDVVDTGGIDWDGNGVCKWDVVDTGGIDWDGNGVYYLLLQAGSQYIGIDKDV